MAGFGHEQTVGRGAEFRSDGPELDHAARFFWHDHARHNPFDTACDGLGPSGSERGPGWNDNQSPGGDHAVQHDLDSRRRAFDSRLAGISAGIVRSCGFGSGGSRPRQSSADECEAQQACG